MMGRIIITNDMRKRVMIMTLILAIRLKMIIIMLTTVTTINSNTIIMGLTFDGWKAY